MLIQNGVRVYPVEKHAIEKGRHKNKIILGYGHLGCEEIAEGIRRLRMSLRPQAFGKRPQNRFELIRKRAGVPEAEHRPFSLSLSDSALNL